MNSTVLGNPPFYSCGAIERDPSEVAVLRANHKHKIKCTALENQADHPSVIAYPGITGIRGMEESIRLYSTHTKNKHWGSGEAGTGGADGGRGRRIANMTDVMTFKLKRELIMYCTMSRTRAWKSIAKFTMALIEHLFKMYFIVQYRFSPAAISGKGHLKITRQKKALG